MTNANVIQSLWIGKQLSTLEILCLQSFIGHGHTFHLYTYEPVAGLPPRVIVKDANTIIPKEMLFMDTLGSWGAFADWFRYQLVFMKGGCWVDMDSVCVRPFEISEEYCFSSEYNEKANVQINVGFIKAPAGSAVLAECINYIELRGLRNIQWGEIGPAFFSKIVARHNLGQYVRRPEVFCPIHYNEMHKLIGEYTYEPAPETLSIHFWNELWRRGSLNKNATYHPISLYETMKKKHLLS